MFPLLSSIANRNIEDRGEAKHQRQLKATAHSFEQLWTGIGSSSLPRAASRFSSAIGGPRFIGSTLRAR